MIKHFFANEASGSVILIVAATLAILLANIDTTQYLYASLLAIPVEFRVGDLHILINMQLWINDALMAIFFLSIGLEVKREAVSGMLASREKVILPFIAALGGMLAPGLIFLLFNGVDKATSSGWAIPIATDIAFALGVLTLIGNRVTPTLKIFLMTLAIIDDLGAIIIIALFYTSNLSLFFLSVAGIVTIVLALLNYFKVRRTSLYIVMGVALWVAVLKSGVHATLAGVIVGFFIPLTEKEETSPSRILEHALQSWSNWVILPLFAFANAGVNINCISVSEFFSILPLSIMFSLFIGKPLGITLFCWLGIRLGIAKLPQNNSLSDIAAVGVLCGIGFTMAIFISSLAYGKLSSKLIVLAKLGILSGSMISAVVGWLLVHSKLRYSYLLIKK